MNDYPATPDGRYFVVRGRLWRRSNPALSPDEKKQLTSSLMVARRAKGAALRVGDLNAKENARRHVESTKIALGERGPVWWTDGAPDLNQHLVKTTPYAAWFRELDDRASVL